MITKKSRQTIFKRHTGFTLVELMVSVGIFALMTALLVAKYGTFNQGILLTNLAYDVALTLRTAQSYGLNVKSVPSAAQNYSIDFDSPYGVHFDKSTPTAIIFFSDKNINQDGTFGNNTYDGTSEDISTYNIKRGSSISSICTGTGPGIHCFTVNSLDVVFRRPDPDAIMTGGAVYAEIGLHSTDGGSKKVIIRSTGQIVVSN